MNYELTVVMPVYNEEGCIETVVRGWLEVLQNATGPSRLLVVDDGSRDRTALILDALASECPELQVVHQPNAGHGAALRTAYQMAADSEWVFQVDSDGQFLPSEFGLLWDRRGEGDFIMGYRKERRDAPVRMLISRTLRVIILALFGCSIRDANIPFRLVKGEALKGWLTLIPEGVFIPNVLLSVLACGSGRAVQDVPVTHLERKTGKVSIANFRLVKAVLRCTSELVSFRFGPFRSFVKASVTGAAGR